MPAPGKISVPSRGTTSKPERGHSAPLRAFALPVPCTGLTRRIILTLILFLFSLLNAFAQTPAPFLNLRSHPSGYGDTVADPDLATNPTSPKVLWFGPTNELFWTASYAFRRIAPSVSLIPCWSGDPWKSGSALLSRMVFQQKPVAVLGSIDSASTHIAEQIIAKAMIPLVSPIATDPSLTLAGVPWMFSCAPSDVAIAKAIVDCVGENQHPAAVFSGTDHESRMTTREILKEFSRRGRLPGFKFEFEPGAVQVDRQIDALVQSKPRAIILVASAEDAGRLLPRLHPIAPIIAGPTVSRRACLTLAGPAAEGVRFPALISPPHDHPFAEAFESTHGYLPDYTAWLTFDAASLLATAIQKCGNAPSQLPHTIPSLSPYQGATGEIRFDPTGQNTRGDLGMEVISSGHARSEPRRRRGRLRRRDGMITTKHAGDRSAGRPAS